MTPADGPGSATPTTPAASLSIAAAAQMLDAQDAAAQATPAQPDPAPEAVETDTDTSQTAAPEQVEEGTPEVEESAPEEEAEDQSDPDGDYVEIGDEKILIEDLVKTHKRFNDFRAQVTRKEQALAQERTTLEGQRKTVEDTVAQVTQQVMAREAEIERAREQVASELQRYRAQIESLDPIVNSAAQEWEKFDWDKLAADDPLAVGPMQVRYQKFLNSQRHLANEKAELDQRSQVEYLHHVQQSKELLHRHITTHHPELTAPETGNQFWADMVATAKSAGLSDEIILAATGQNPDRAVRVLDPANLNLWVKATKYDRLQKTSSSVAQPAKGATTPTELPRMRVVKGTAPRPRPGTVERARIGGHSAAFAAKPSLENALAILDAKDAYKARSRR